MAFIQLTNQAEQGDRIVVSYDSVRGDGVMTRSGQIEYADTEPDAVIAFRRNDGQRMKVTDDDELRSVGSTHPFTGSVTDVKIEPPA